MSSKDKTTRSHEHVVRIEAPAEEVWKAITDERDLTRWFPLGAKVSPGAGGAMTLSWGSDFQGTNRIEIWEPPGRLRTSWMDHAQAASVSPEVEGALPVPTPDEETRRRIAVDWFIEGKGGTTVLRLVHGGFSASKEWDSEYDGTNRGWDFELRSLKHYLERHRGRDRRAFWLRRRALGAADASWAAVTGPGGIFREGTVAGLREGDRFGLMMANGDRLEGTVLIHNPSRDFAATVATLEDGLFRIGYENFLDAPEIHLWLSTWGVPESRVAELESTWRSLLERALP